MTAEIERLTGRLATTEEATQRAERDKSADDQFVAARSAAELAAARAAAYPALDARLGTKRPTQAAQVRPGGEEPRRGGCTAASSGSPTS